MKQWLHYDNMYV